MHVDQAGGSEQGHVRAAEQSLPVVGSEGGAEEDEQGGEDGGGEGDGEGEGEEGGLDIYRISHIPNNISMGVFLRVLDSETAARMGRTINLAAKLADTESAFGVLRR